MSSTTVALDIKSDPSQRYNNPLQRGTTGGHHSLQLQPSYHLPRKNESGSFAGVDDVDTSSNSLAGTGAAGEDDSSGYHHDQHHHAGAGLDGSSRHDNADYSLLDHEDLDPSLLSNQHDEHGGHEDEGGPHAEAGQEEGSRPPVSTNSSGAGGAGGGKSKSAAGGGGTKRKKKDEDMIVDPEAGVVSA